MKKRLYSFIYYHLLGWKTKVSVPNFDKCVICAAPHTSNWDLFIGKLFYGAIGRKTSFMMKKEWFFFPLGLLFKAAGGIPVDRKHKTSLVDQMAEKFAESKHFHLAITPEGTRKRNTNWKKGFYYIALKAQVPIVLIGIDYPSKSIVSTKAITPTGDIEKDMQEIKLYFKNFTGEKPREFCNLSIMASLRVSIVQTDIVWENKQRNLHSLRERLETVRNQTELVVIPETFSTGFSMNTELLAEPSTGETLTTLRQLASEFQVAITGSFIARDDTPSSEKPHYYNRAFFLTPEGNTSYYDKRHLFRMGQEADSFTPGNHRLVFSFHGWNILLLICYDLRFPVWSRNVNNEYDLLIYVANWPASRRKVWDVLLQARALENMSYVCGVNRIGKDNNGLTHNGGSCIYSPKGKLISSIPDDEEGIATALLDLTELRDFRNKFPAWKDADRFTISSDSSSL